MPRRIDQGDLFAGSSLLESRRSGGYVRRRDEKSHPASSRRSLITDFIQSCAAFDDVEHSAPSITTVVVQAYWDRLVQARLPTEGSDNRPGILDLRQPSDPPFSLRSSKVAAPLFFRAERLASWLARLDVLEAGYWIGMVYTALLPKETRSRLGVYYTPPPLTERLLDLAQNAGVDWRRACVLDPACGGGAFLAPVARRVRTSGEGESPDKQLERVSRQVRGLEIDPFGAWLSQVLLDAEMLEISCAAGERLPVCVDVVDTLKLDPANGEYDAVVGNPPYGRTKLDTETRAKYARSLFGHANLYGLFTDQALRLARPDGVVAFITPTSFVAGQYFKRLRSLLANTAPPVALDFVEARSGVFEDVLQETALAVFRRAGPRERAAVHTLNVSSAEGAVEIVRVGDFALPDDGSAPWIIPRDRDTALLASRLEHLPHRLRDYGYRVKTGPLVWNRHKPRLHDEDGADCYPIIWSEAVRPEGAFHFRSEKRSHAPYFSARGPDDDWLLTRTGCVVLQRTTAKEQKRRLVAAQIPDGFVAKHGAVVIENHLNMLVPVDDVNVRATAEVLVAIFNSTVVDRAFRCMNGSVAVSAFELEALPLPGPDVLTGIEALLNQGAPAHAIEDLIERSYFDAGSAAAPALGKDSAAA